MNRLRIYFYLIDGLEKLANDERHRLDAFDFFLSVKVLLLQVPLLVLDVFLLHPQKLKLLLQLLVPRVLYKKTFMAFV